VTYGREGKWPLRPVKDRGEKGREYLKRAKREMQIHTIVRFDGKEGCSKGQGVGKKRSIKDGPIAEARPLGFRFLISSSGKENSGEGPTIEGGSESESSRWLGLSQGRIEGGF